MYEFIDASPPKDLFDCFNKNTNNKSVKGNNNSNLKLNKAENKEENKQIETQISKNIKKED